MNFQAAEDFILSKLRRELSHQLTYHGVHHTLDVLSVAEHLCRTEKISLSNTTLLRTAALYHDSGFTVANANHETFGCAIARSALPNFGYSNADIEKICGMIMATKIPQTPLTRLEEILCDADLDYLGRSDFYSIGETLYEELCAFQVLGSRSDWNNLQIKFLQAHHFFTPTNQRLREPQKQLFLAELLQK